MTSPRRRENGFTLIEVLVAFIVLSMSLGVIMSILSVSMRTSRTASTDQYALMLAESKLSELVGTPELKVGRREGEFDDAYRWEAHIEPWEFPDQDPGTVYTFMPYRVEVAVIWGDHDRERFTLSSIYIVDEDTL
ncbi:prepilin-type N-terminal cleavage/methylation domain-containing protein [Pontibacterium sp.]|uniref:type IV pilus modification PilV family protein n=1 Tax=Pontibacterium sp. TaxID=2036026 RepID=UPI003514F2B7